MLFKGENKVQEVEYSIIVPVYKAENTIKRCVESILAQTYEKFEVILIDDGSPDRSGEICDEYSRKDSRVVVIHQKNKGVSAARNVGLQTSVGKYIVFVDSDDYIEEDALSQYNYFSDNLLISGVTYLSENGKVENIICDNAENFTLEDDSCIIEYLKKWYAIQVWGKRYCREIIMDNELCFDENVDYGEDAIFNIQYALLVKKGRTVGKKTYVFCKSFSDSLSKQGDKWVEKYSDLQSKLFELFPEYKAVQGFLLNKFWWTMETRIAEISQSSLPKKEKQKRVSEILETDFFQKCIDLGIVSHTNRVIRFGIKYRKYRLIVWIYGLMRRKRIS